MIAFGASESTLPTTLSPFSTGIAPSSRRRVIARVPTLHREGGFEFLFRALDRPEPPHVHVIGNDGQAKVWLAPTVKLDTARGYNSTQIARIIRISEEHRVEWIQAWQRFFGAG